MRPETKRERHWFCSNREPLKLVGGHMRDRSDPSISEPANVYNTAAIRVLTADRRIPT